MKPSFVFLILCVLFPEPLRAESARPQVDLALKSAASELKLTEEQKKLFEVEALFDPMPFVANLKTEDGQTFVEIDREKLDRFLKVDAKLFGLGATPKVCAYARAAPDCAFCGPWTGPVAAALERRLARRGFVVHTGPETPAASVLSSASAFEDFSSRAVEELCSAAAYIELSRDRGPDEEEASTLKMRAEFFMRVKPATGDAVTGRFQAVLQVPKGLEAVSKERGAEALAKVAPDVIAQLALGQRSASSEPNSPAQERFLRLEGVHSYTDYIRFKDAVLTSYPELKLEERLISPGSFQFLLGGGESLAEVEKKIALVKVGERGLQVSRKGDDEIVVVMR